jgi:hypothetical protein
LKPLQIKTAKRGWIRKIFFFSELGFIEKGLSEVSKEDSSIEF